MENTEQGFVVTAGKRGNCFFRSFHKTAEHANTALRRTIDVDALQVVGATVTFATNGNVRRWNMTPSVG